MRRFYLFAVLLFVGATALAQTLPSFDFTQSDGAKDWIAVHDLAPLKILSEGLIAQITGNDPYMHGPARDYPPGVPLWMTLRLKSEAGGGAQMFYFEHGASEENSVRFFVPGGNWQEVRVPMPALGPRTRFRFDPPGSHGVCTVASISFSERPIPTEPTWPKPEAVAVHNGKTVRSGELIIESGNRFGEFLVRIGTNLVASGNTRSMIGYTIGKSNRWIEIGANRLKDAEGATWTFAQEFRKGKIEGAIDVITTCSVDADRAVIFLPMLTLFPGRENFGTNKAQGLFPGLEYLENEPSSSQADIIGPGARRKVPDALKVTIPLMTVAANGSYVAVSWEQQPNIAALYDSPDRTFNSGGHAMALIFPGADPAMREDGAILPYGGTTLRANQKLTVRATIFAGRGDTVIPAVQKYLQQHALPELPATGYSADEYFTLEAHGWLDSKIRDDAKFRHAVGNGFGSAAVADAPFYMDFLATKVHDNALAERLRAQTRESLAVVAPPNFNAAAVGHIRHPVEALVFGSVLENAATALAQARGQIVSFSPQRTMEYYAPAKGLDLGKTHSSREANGLTATHVAAALEHAAFSGDRAAINAAVELLRGLDKFRNGVPRGAQTWEVPLHTPDILASAYLVRAYLLGYELTGDFDFLEQAKYWAWTGVPFIYLTPPTAGKVGVYSTVPVFGATQFTAPNWMGLPVQWCGLVYGDAIRRLARYDERGPWIKVANGIAAAGIQHMHTAAELEYQGLLPDSYDLRAQSRNPVPINPATLMPEAIQYYGLPTTYDFRALLNHKLLVHAPGPLTAIRESKDKVEFKVASWAPSPWYVLVNGVTNTPAIKINHSDAKPFQFDAATGRLVLQLSGPSTIELTVR